MKNLKTTFILILTMLSINLVQTQVKLNLDIVDEFTGAIEKRTNSYIIGKSEKGRGKLRMYAYRSDDFNTAYFDAFGLGGCAGATGNYAMFKFTDGTVLQLEDIGDVDCGGGFVVVLINLNDFTDKKVDKIRIKRSEGYMDYQVQGEGKYTLIELFNAINN